MYIRDETFFKDILNKNSKKKNVILKRSRSPNILNIFIIFGITVVLIKTYYH